MTRRRLGLVLGWLGVGLVIGLSLWPAPDTGYQSPYSDKWGHALAYATLMFWFGVLYPRLLVRLIYLGGFFLLGVALEGLQGLLPYRDASVLDALANLTGLLLALAVLQTALRRRSG